MKRNTGIENIQKSCPLRAGISEDCVLIYSRISKKLVNTLKSCGVIESSAEISKCLVFGGEEGNTIKIEILNTWVLLVNAGLCTECIQ